MKFKKYLDAKASVEKRCLDEGVLEEVKNLLRGREEASVLEVGSGTGSMAIHLIERDILPDRTRYVGVDKNGDLLSYARERLSKHSLFGRKGTRKGGGDRDGDDVLTAKGTTVEFHETDLYDIEGRGKYDLVIAHAVLDLLELDSAVESLLRFGDIFYFPVCFDGVTAFEPRYNESLDREIKEVYHRSMDESGGSSQTGREVFGAIEKAGGTVTSAGSSDWVIFPGEDSYTEDEKYLLRYIVETVYDGVSEKGSIDQNDLDMWLEDRHRRIENGELVYIAHQLDVAGKS